MAANDRNLQVLNKLNKNLESGNYYEALQLYKLINHRYTGSRKFKEANDLLRSGITTLFKQNLTPMATELYLLLLENFKLGKVSTDQATVGVIKELFNLFPNTPDPGKNSVMRSILRWAEDSKNKDAEDDLQGFFAEILWREKDYGNAQKHFVKSSHIERFGDMLLEWSEQGNKSEKDLFIARAVFMYLCMNNVQRAKSLFEYLMLRSQELKTPLINFLKLLLLATEHGRLDLFDTIRKKYQPSLSRDPNFVHFLDKIAQVIFKAGNQAPTGLQGIMGEFMRSMFEPESSNARS